MKRIIKKKNKNERAMCDTKQLCAKCNIIAFIVAVCC